MDLMKLPNDPFEKRFAFLKEGYVIYGDETIKFIQSEYPNRDELYRCLDFMSYNLEETSRSDLETLDRVWFFPTMEVINELNECLFKSLTVSYKSGYDSLRRAIEIIIVGSYFTLSEVKAEDAKQWLNSQKETPMFSRAIKSLLKNKRFQKLENNTLWITNLKNFFWHLSDIIHTRGKNYSLSYFQPSNISFDGFRPPQFSKENLNALLDTFILTFKHICTCIAISNPILLLGLPVDEKYGFDTPVSGFFREHQSKDLLELLIPDTINYFRKLVSTDIELIYISKWMSNLPDKTEAEIKKQVEEFKADMEKLRKGNIPKK